jgi:glyoxylase-like metal-dependent hydrolase (beta-lactamase superfamily II)
VRLISTPGHTRGHMSVLLRTAQLGEVLVVGDAAYTVRSIDEQLVPLLMGGGEDAYRRSLAELNDFADEHQGAIVVPSHDPTAWRAFGAPVVEPV